MEHLILLADLQKIVEKNSPLMQRESAFFAAQCSAYHPL